MEDEKAFESEQKMKTERCTLEHIKGPERWLVSSWRFTSIWEPI